MLKEALNELLRLYKLRDEGEEVTVQIIIAEDLLRCIIILETMEERGER